ncbi:MAG: hypothetical protein ACK56I_04645, partial [bacterium]
GGITERPAQHPVPLHAGRTGGTGHLTAGSGPAGRARVAADGGRTGHGQAAEHAVPDVRWGAGCAGVAAPGGRLVLTRSVRPAGVRHTVVDICEEKNISQKFFF